MTPFFTSQGLEFFQQRLINKPKAGGGASDEHDKDKIRREIYEPSNKWARLLAEALPDYAYKLDNRVLGQFARLKKYSWARLYLRELGDKHIYFRVGVAEGGGNLTYNIDCFWKKLSSREEEVLWADIKQSGAKDQPIYPDDFPDYDWPRLIEETVGFIKKYEPLFRHLHTLLDVNMEAAQKAKKEAAAAFAAKFSNPNIILYGPPGTGKTHNTLALAYELIKGVPPAQYADAQKLFKDEQGKQIEFVTFHQSFSYEDFVQGIKPEVNGTDQLVFKPRNGIFYNIAHRAREEYQRQHLDPDVSVTVPFVDVFNQLLEPLIEQQVSAIQIPMKSPGSLFPITDIGNGSITFRRGQEGQVINVQNAHLQSLYEKTTTLEKPTGTQIYYLYIVQRLWDLAKELSTNAGPADPAVPQVDETPRNYVLIIDEINRANISKVFGELITLLEKDKRLGGDNPLSVTLPSGEAKFNVPANLYIIGTMNTADKSIALLDIALRRRFEFKALYPIYKQQDGQYFEHGEVFEKLNKQIVRLKSRDFQIGHAYFMNQPGKAAEPLADILNKKVIPLLYEYFLNDDKKVKEALVEAKILVHEDADTGLLRHGTTA